MPVPSSEYYVLVFQLVLESGVKNSKEYVN